MTTLIKDEPCCDCPSNVRVWDEPPYWVCKESMHGDHDCTRYFATYDLEELARGVADDLAHHCRHVEAQARKDLADNIADAIDNAMQMVGARLDVSAFLKLSEVKA